MSTKLEDLQALSFSAQILKDLAESLTIASGSSFMSREHAALIWKNTLKVSGFNVEKEPKKI